MARKHILTVVNSDECFVEPPPKSLQSLILKSVKNVVMNQFVSDNMKIKQAARIYAADLKTSVCNTWTPKELLVLEAFFTKAEKCCVLTVLGYLAELMNDSKESPASLFFQLSTTLMADETEITEIYENGMKILEDLTNNAHEIQDQVLEEILTRNAGTEYLSRFFLNGQVDKQNFKTNVPIVTYDGTKPYIYRIAG
ncbi:hypothetical protein V6N13_009776 [Hibiscus sabdariffa]